MLAGTFECVERVGIGKTTVEDAARASGVSRATVYRLFPGGRDELLRETVAWEMARFFAHLGSELGPMPDFETFLERALPLAREQVLGHAVLQKVLETEPDRLMPLITVEQHHVISYIAAYFLPLLERDREAGLLAEGVELEQQRRVRRPDGVVPHRLAWPSRPRRPRRGAPPRPQGAPRRNPAGPGRRMTMRHNVVYCLRE